MKRLQGGNATMIPEAVFVEECKVRFLVRQCTSPGQDVTTGEAGCHLKLRQDVAVHLFAHHKTACLLTLSPLACHEAACSEPVKRRFRQKSGRRGSNPRQPAWKAGGCALAARLIYIGLTAGFIRYTCNMSVPGKTCHARFFRDSAKHVTCFFPRFWQKTLRESRGRRSLCWINYTSSLHLWQCFLGKKFSSYALLLRSKTDI
jgi:hypothetical protein